MNTTEKNRKNSGTGKTILIIILAALTVVGGYLAIDQYNQKKELIASMEEERRAHDQYVQDAFATIEHNLAEIRKHEGVIHRSIEGENAEGPVSPEKRIEQEIRIIEALMAENRKIISDLNLEVSNKNDQLTAYESNVNPHCALEFATIWYQDESIFKISAGRTTDFFL